MRTSSKTGLYCSLLAFLFKRPVPRSLGIGTGITISILRSTTIMQAIFFGKGSKYTSPSSIGQARFVGIPMKYLQLFVKRLYRKCSDWPGATNCQHKFIYC